MRTHDMGTRESTQVKIIFKNEQRCNDTQELDHMGVWNYVNFT